MKKILYNLYRSWYIYLLTTFIACFSMVYLVNAINQPRNEETISLFVASCSVNNGTLKNKLNEQKPNYLREIVVNSSIYYSSDFDYIYTAYGKSNSDLILLPESKLYDSAITYYYAALDEQYVETFIPDAEYYVPKEENEENKSYGIKIRNEGDTNNKIITFSNSTYDENYYAFIYKNSLHGGELTSSNYTTALDFAKIVKDGAL